MANIEAVVYDIGNVLIEWNPERFYDAEIGGVRRRALFEAVDIYAMNHSVDLGADFAGTVRGLAEAHQDFSAEIMLFHDLWIKMARPDIPWSVRLMRALRGKGVPVFALSNFGVGTFEIALEHYDFLGEFDQQYVSGYLKVMKPEPAIYEALEQGCGIAPDRLLFTDDSAENIVAATARGWKTHHFEGPDGWAKSLVDHGVLTQEEAGL